MDYKFPVTKTMHPKARPTNENELGFAKYFTDHMFVMDYDEGQGWHDGRIVPNEPFLIDPASCVLHYAQLAFEGMKAYRNPQGGVQMFRPEKNIVRMMDSCERMCIPVIPTDLFMAALDQLLRVDMDWVPSAPGTALYIRPFAFADEMTFSVKPAKHFRFMIILTATGPYYAANAHGLGTNRIYVEDEYIRAAEGGTGYTKCGGNYGGAMRASLNADKYKCNDVLWLDAVEHKYVEEVGTSNAFFYIGDEVVTPPLTTGTILPGVTRDSVLQLLKKWGVKVSERRISMEEVRDAAKAGKLKEIFATGTAAVISPVGCLCYKGEDFLVGDGQVGALSQKLYDAITGIQTGVLEDDMGWVHKIEA